MSKTQKSFISGAVILAAGSLMAKFLGMFFRLPIAVILGKYGGGLYELAYPIYNTFLSISTTGLPIAVSKMVSERMSTDDYSGAYKIFGVAFRTMAVLGATISIVMFLSANLLIKIFGWPQDAFYSIASISLAPFFVSMVSAYRGFFQGMQRMSHPAISQICDQVGRVGFGLLLAYMLTNAYGVAIGAAGATFGAVAGSLFSLTYLSVMYSRMKKQQYPLIKAERQDAYKESTKVIVKSLVLIAIPVMIGSFVNTIMDLINTATIPNLLAGIGYTAEEAASLIGTLGYTSTLTNVPLVLGSSLSASLVPFISKAFTGGEKRSVLEKQTSLAVRTSFYVSLPCAVGLSVLSAPIFALLFPTIEGGADLLKYAAFIGIFTIAGSNLQAILQGSGYFYKALSSLVVTAVVKVLANMIFVRIPELNIYGAILSSVLSSFVLFMLNFTMVKKYVGVGKCFGSIFKTTASAVTMGVFAHYSYMLLSSFLGGKIGVVVSIALSAVVYAALLLLTKAVTKDDIKEIRG